MTPTVPQSTKAYKTEGVLRLESNSTVIDDGKESSVKDVVPLPQLSSSTDGIIGQNPNSTAPLMIIHIGPRKTASTTLQMLLAFSIKRLLKVDLFTFINKKYTCLDFFVETKRCLATREEFEDNLEKLRLSGMNVILSSEKLANTLLNETNILQLKQLTSGWNVRIVATYRRYFDWLLSEYDQELKRKEGYNKNIPTLIEYYESVESGANPFYAPLNSLLVNAIKRHFQDLYIFNIHGERRQDTTSNDSFNNDTTKDNLITRFICDSIPEAEHTCNSLRTGNVPKSSRFGHSNEKNEKTSAEALLITVATRKKNHIRFDVHDEDAYFNIANTVDDYLSHLYRNDSIPYQEKPLNCLSEKALGDILNESIAIEQQLLPDFHQSENGGHVLESMFATFFEEKKFCQLDINAFLEKELDNLLHVLNQ